MSVKLIDDSNRNIPAISLVTDGSYLDKKGDLCIYCENGDLVYPGGVPTGSIIKQNGRQQLELFTPVDLEIKVVRK